jgi:preprotein translocase subunit SecD
MYYRLPGLAASGALIVYSLLALAVFKLIPVTLTLAGIAGFILSLGMAVDANILIFERMKEELRRGRTLNAAIDIGFRRAWSSIRDSNISTLITCFILYWFGNQFGASVVKGFALTLAIGVGISMFSAITVTRTFLKMVLGTPLAKSHWLFNAEEVKRTAPARRAAEASD